MDLPRGITGFRDRGEAPLSSCDMKAFRSHCFAVARSISGRVVRGPDDRPNGSASFAMAVLESSSIRVAVLLNEHFPVIGFAVPPRAGETGPLQFMEGGELAEALGATGDYEVLSQAELEQPVRAKDFAQLAPAEMQQVKYWRPARVGDVVFNFWD